MPDREWLKARIDEIDPSTTDTNLQQQRAAYEAQLHASKAPVTKPARKAAKK